jgi:hypothetical protein
MSIEMFLDEVFALEEKKGAKKKAVKLTEKEKHVLYCKQGTPFESQINRTIVKCIETNTVHTFITRKY